MEKLRGLQSSMHGWACSIISVSVMSTRAHTGIATTISSSTLPCSATHQLFEYLCRLPRRGRLRQRLEGVPVLGHGKLAQAAGCSVGRCGRPDTICSYVGLSLLCRCEEVTRSKPGEAGGRAGSRQAGPASQDQGGHPSIHPGFFLFSTTTCCQHSHRHRIV